MCPDYSGVQISGVCNKYIIIVTQKGIDLRGGGKLKINQPCPDNGVP